MRCERRTHKLKLDFVWTPRCTCYSKPRRLFLRKLHPEAIPLWGNFKKTDQFINHWLITVFRHEALPRIIHNTSSSSTVPIHRHPSRVGSSTTEECVYLERSCQLLSVFWRSNILSEFPIFFWSYLGAVPFHTPYCDSSVLYQVLVHGSSEIYPEWTHEQ